LGRKNPVSKKEETGLEMKKEMKGKMKMNTGMLWFDSDAKTTLAAKVREAARYYEKKFGTAPDLVVVHPTMDDRSQVPGIEVRASRVILPNHLWMGRKA
jgi:hypothetical protein